MNVSPKGVAFILQFEGYRPHPYVPSDTSGVTIGYGYDLSAVDAEQFMTDWSGVLNDPALMSRLGPCCGLRGAAARQVAIYLADVVISRHAADVVFQSRSLPAYVARAAKACPGFEALSQGTVDALVSLGYNRGWDMGVPGTATWERRKEMRAIRDAVARRDEPAIRKALLDMADRLWGPETWAVNDVAQGLNRRRKAEAALIGAAA